MTQDSKSILLALLKRYHELGITEQIDYNKFYLYSIITHSTAIEGSTVTEVEAQLLFDEGITSGKRSIIEQMMNLDLKSAYEFGIQWIKQHQPITTEGLILLASKVMEHTGTEYHSMGGNFSSAKGELRKLNVTAGLGGRSYMSYLKVPSRLNAFCEELNRRRAAIDKTDIAAVYELSFWAHYELVTIHPWADGNGRTCRLLMNLMQIEFDVLPSKVLKEDKSSYIQALVDSREKDDNGIFIECMTQLHCKNIQTDIDNFVDSIGTEMADKQSLMQKMVDKWSIKPILAEKMADILIFLADKDFVTTENIISTFGLSETTAKRYLRQLVQIGYLEAQGGNKNRRYTLKNLYN